MHIIHRAAATAACLAAMFLSGCDGATITIEPIKTSSSMAASSSLATAFSSESIATSSAAPITDLCAELNGTGYYSSTLELGGETPDGSGKAHWQLHFKDGVVDSFQSDFVASGTYQCIHDQVIVNFGAGEEIIDVGRNLRSLSVTPAGASVKLTYYPLKSSDSGDCRLVAGKHYTSGDQATNRIEQGPIYLDFKYSPNMFTYSYIDGKEPDSPRVIEEGYYDCTTDKLHLHFNESKFSELTVTKNAEALVFFDYSYLKLELIDVPVLCTKEYNPVCGIVPTNIVCVTTPCPTEEYKTFGNDCEAKNARADIAFKGECGEKEGQPVIEDPIVCNAQYLPVCAKVPANIQCITAPCPSHEYKTFGNQCTAGKKAMTSFQGECDAIKLQNMLTFEQQPARLFNVDRKGPPIEQLPRNSGISLIDAVIDGDILKATLGYSGCNPQQIYYNVDASVLLESFPEQVSYTFSKANRDGLVDCDAYFESVFEYDLLPLRANYRTQVEEGGSGGLFVLGLGGPLYKR